MPLDGRGDVLDMIAFSSTSRVASRATCVVPGMAAISYALSLLGARPGEPRMPPSPLLGVDKGDWPTARKLGSKLLRIVGRMKL